MTDEKLGKIILFTIAICIITIPCLYIALQPLPENQAASKEIVVRESTDIEYIRDPRTGLCFAVMTSTVMGAGVYSDVKSFTNVSCTAKRVYDATRP